MRLTAPVWIEDIGVRQIEGVGVVTALGAADRIPRVYWCLLELRLADALPSAVLQPAHLLIPHHEVALPVEIFSSERFKMGHSPSPALLRASAIPELHIS